MEKSIDKQILEYLNSLPNCKAIKIPPINQLDILCCYNGLFIWFEDKQPGEHMTHQQQVTGRHWENAGALVFEVHSKGEVIDVIDAINRFFNGCDKLMGNSYDDLLDLQESVRVFIYHNYPKIKCSF